MITNIEDLENSDWIKAVTLARHGTLDTWAGLKARQESRRHYGPGDHPNGSPQTIHGSGGGSTPLTIAKQGGDSLQPATGRRPTKGYMVAKPPSYGVIVSAEEWFDKGDEILTDFVDERIGDFKADPDLFVGVWWDKAHAEFALDQSLNVFDLDEAIAKARAWDQQAIWDVENFEEIPTGGTGGRSATSGYQAAEGLGEDDPRGEARLGAYRRGRDQGWQDQEVATALRAFYLRYDPNQPRDPAGTDTGGQWTKAIGVTSGEFWTGHKNADKATAARIRAELAKYNITLAAVTREMHRRVELAKGMPDPYPDDPANPESAYDSGLSWYSRAHQTALELGDGDIVKGAGMVAAMSPLTDWPSNLRAVKQLKYLMAENPDATADQIVELWRAGAKSRSGELYAKFGNTGLGLGESITKAFDIAHGTPPGDVLSGAKVRNFYNNIADDGPGDNSITIDGHMGKVISKASPNSTLWGNKTRTTQVIAQSWVAKETGMAVDGVGYQFTAAAIRNVAADLGLRPEQVQAIVWNTAVLEPWDAQKVGVDRPLTGAQQATILENVNTQKAAKKGRKRSDTIDAFTFTGADPDLDDTPLQDWVIENPNGWSREEQITFCRINGLFGALDQI